MTEQDESFEDLLTDLESSRRTIAKEQEEIAAYRRELEALKQETAQKKEKLEEQRDRILREANEKHMRFWQMPKRQQMRQCVTFISLERPMFRQRRWRRAPEKEDGEDTRGHDRGSEEAEEAV